ncbi:MAG: redoxin domain-containing protein, partial [Candidatus Scalindua sp.]|nr:redoxin domain-containing protein [Candidatus Scalindua sp.]
MNKETFLISTILLIFVSLSLAFSNNVLGMRQDADAGLQLDIIRENLSSYSKMKPEDTNEYYENALNELHALVDMFSGTEEALEAVFYIGAICNQLKQYDEAIKYFDEVLTFKGEINQNFEIRLLYFKAKALIGRGRVFDAKDVIAELRVIEPGAANSFGKELGGTIKLGMSAPEVNTTDYKGNPISLSKYKGKIAIIDFWATWSDYCVQDFSETQKMYRKVNDPGVQFIGVSLDDEVEDLKGFALQKNIEWPQIFEGMRWKGYMSKLYNV